MENVFIDTSIFVAENFMDGTRLKGLFKLFREGRLKSTMPLITVNEVKSQFKNRTETAIMEHNQAMNNKKLWVLRNYPKGKDMISKFPKPEIVSAGFNKQFDSLLKEAGTEIIPYPIIDTKNLFKKYFREEKPFGKADKKHEFPDAIAIETLKQWCNIKKKNCIVLSTDKDLKAIKHRRLQVENNFQEFIDKTLKKILVIERKETVEMLFRKNKTKLKAEVKKWLSNELDDTSLYDHATNWMEVHDVQIPFISVSVKNYQITKIDDELISAEITTKARAKIQLEIDDESSWVKDYDDGRVHYRETTKLEFEEQFEITLSVVFNVVSKDDYDDKIEIEEYNNGKVQEIAYTPCDY